MLGVKYKQVIRNTFKPGESAFFIAYKSRYTMLLNLPVLSLVVILYVGLVNGRNKTTNPDHCGCSNCKCAACCRLCFIDNVEDETRYMVIMEKQIAVPFFCLTSRLPF